jgi:anti-anti-sigma factor
MPVRRLPPRAFSGEVRMSDQIALIDLHGEVDAFANPELQKLFARATGSGPDGIGLNFGDVDYVNSTGVALIVGLVADGKRAGIPLAAFGLSEHYREIFEITRLTDFISVTQDEESALALFAQLPQSD